MRRNEGRKGVKKEGIHADTRWFNLRMREEKTLQSLQRQKAIKVSTES